MQESLIDPEEFPFTELEMRQALALIFDAERAATDSREHAAAMRQEVIDRAAFRALVAAAQPDPGYVPPALPDVVPVISYSHYFWYPEEALALLTLVSEHLAARVAVHRANRLTANHPRRVRQALWNAARILDAPLTPSVAALLDAENLVSEKAWQKVLRRMKRAVIKHRGSHTST